MSHPPTIAALLAGGRGTRMGAGLPKQLLDVAGKPILQHTLEAFEAAEGVDRIVLVMAEGFHDAAWAIAKAANMTKLSAVIDGGATRADSSVAAIRWAQAQPDVGDDAKLLLHDAARMLVTGRIIADVIAALDECEAVTAAIPSSDTVVEVRDGRIVDVPDRSRLARVQTPQGFRLGLIAAAHAETADPGATPTDDCSVVLRRRPDVPVRIVAGAERNLKVTEPADLALAEALLRS
ncbi:2-C-methyl-D-erythritol 4-phosphate cytidylyltransferase [Glycomyces sp. TRM65418]|uniref:2-C-methyl-D-erythritol 4-phosphate cytidylyltransferase n=1 Tax=Glycomyces sp. TRM65418 TaxID=2867006 RepID=UPI001CE569ED|nr:2-C-methyl-D-erythritol 4-phosphate cytidylyltransferase [Glycomyces sp. TRM65418]MCC3762775.1 2-C-methyl-D-erythritol 4-phosphate cytidylyltransferase [Glycomyces sp. TRM65418]QZD56805.1 2-C-methyl-D-erythritol 4-phosphate cytidylyltransferase [Glycomyces sp. TRM65418]